MNREKLSFDEFKYNYLNIQLPNRPSFIRKGQLLMNYLGDVWFEEYKRITDTKSFDCFYIDTIVPMTLTHLENVWNNRDAEIALDKPMVKIKAEYSNRTAKILPSEDKQKNKVFVKAIEEMSLVEFAQKITKIVDINDLPQLIALIVSIVDTENLSISLIKHFNYLKINYNKQDIDEPFNLLNYYEH